MREFGKITPYWRATRSSFEGAHKIFFPEGGIVMLPEFGQMFRPATGELCNPPCLITLLDLWHSFNISN